MFLVLCDTTEGDGDYVGGFYADGWSNNIKPGTLGEFGEEPEGE